MTDFRPTIARPISFLFGAAAQIGVFAVFMLAYLSGMFTPAEAASVGIIGGSDGPPTVYVAAALARPICSVPLPWSLTPIWRWCLFSSPR